MKSKFLKKLGIAVLSLIIISETTIINPVCVYAEDIQDTKVVADGNRAEENGGSEYDFTEQGAVSGVEASNEAKVTVYSVDKLDIKDSDGSFTEKVIDIDTGSEVIVNEDVNVITQGTVGTQATEVVYAANSNVYINGTINLEDTMLYTKDEEGHRNECVAVGICSEGSKIEVGGDVSVYSKNGIAYGVQSFGGISNIHGSVMTSVGNNNHGATGVLVSPIGDENPTFIVDGDINVKGGYNGTGMNMFGNSKAYIKGNVNIEAAELAEGFNIHENSIAVVDGTLSVKATNSGELSHLAIPYNPFETGDSASCIYVYKYIDDTNYSDIDTSVGTSSDDILDFSHLKYIIRTDEGLTTNANTFSDAGLGISGFYYSGEGETLTVSSNGRTIYGIKNADSSIDIKVHDNGNGTWTIIVPKGGGVHLQAILDRVEEFIYNTPSEIAKPVENVTSSNIDQGSKPMPSVMIEAVVMTQEHLAENVVGSTEYIAKQAEIETTMMQALNYVEAMTAEQLQSVKATGLLIDAGGCVVADTRVSQLIVKALSKGIPMNITFRINGTLVKLAIPAGFDIASFINADGTIDFMKLFNAIHQ